jgi:hypothetical protein
LNSTELKFLTSQPKPPTWTYFIKLFFQVPAPAGFEPSTREY